MGRIATLIDGGFFLKRLPKLVSANRCDSSGKIVACIRHLYLNHVKILTGSRDSRWQQHVYRIFSMMRHPMRAKRITPSATLSSDFGKSDIANTRNALFELLRKARWLCASVTLSVNTTFYPRTCSNISMACNPA
jgi:hypothetical protein